MARPSRIGWIVSLVLCGASTNAAAETPERAPSPAESSRPPHTRPLDVTVETRSDRGIVFCALWPDAMGYPTRQDHAAHEGSSKPLEGQRARIRFEAVAHGEYALACFHDENTNHMLDTNFVGIPSEGTGASNDARGFMGPPSYDDARFFLSPAGPDALTIRIDY